VPDGGVCQDGACYVPEECRTDSDCRAGATCMCSATARGASEGEHHNRLNWCVPTQCASDADCSGFACSATPGPCGWEGFYCHTANDACDGDADCGRDEACKYRLGRWACADRGDCE
jgi:Cys-rich repeat protein